MFSGPLFDLFLEDAPLKMEWTRDLRIAALPPEQAMIGRWADLVPGVKIGMKNRCIQPEFRSEHSKLIELRSNLAEDLI